MFWQAFTELHSSGFSALNQLMRFVNCCRQSITVTVLNRFNVDLSCKKSVFEWNVGYSYHASKLYTFYSVLPVCTETRLLTSSEQLNLCDIWGSQGGEAVDVFVPSSKVLWDLCVDTDVSERRAVPGCNPADEGSKFLRNVVSTCKSTQLCHL